MSPARGAYKLVEGPGIGPGFTAFQTVTMTTLVHLPIRLCIYVMQKSFVMASSPRPINSAFVEYLVLTLMIGAGGGIRTRV